LPFDLTTIAGFFFCLSLGDCEKDTMPARNCCEPDDGNTQAKALSHLVTVAVSIAPRLCLNGLESNVILLMLLDHPPTNGQNT
jgi:hypothetical protein